VALQVGFVAVGRGHGKVELFELFQISIPSF
jgi:hypothetical protein